MSRASRRRFLCWVATGGSVALAGCNAPDGTLGQGSVASTGTNTTSEATRSPSDESTTTRPTTATSPAPNAIEVVGHSLLDRPKFGFNEGRIRSDGQVAVVGSDSGNGSYLVDLADPTDPTLSHRLPSTADNRDVKFDPLRPGRYYRNGEFREAGSARVQVIDYGYDRGTPTDPVVAVNIPAGDTHNLYPHPEEPLLYTINGWPDTPLFDVWDVEDPTTARRVRVDADLIAGVAHDLLVDPVEELLHVTVIDNTDGGFEGYRIYDLASPRRPTLLGTFDYRDTPDYEAVGTPGFEGAHMVDVAPERGLAVVGDEKIDGIPGGKHVFDLGWDAGSPSDPVPIGFVHSPNARSQDEAEEQGDWTGHNFDLVGDGNRLVSGDNHEGIVLYDLADPRDPEPVDRYPTDEGIDRSNGPVEQLGGPPMTWSAHYADSAGLGVASDVLTGIYVFRLR